MKAGNHWTRRDVLLRGSELGIAAALAPLMPAYAWAELPKAPITDHPIDLVIERSPFLVNGKKGSAVTVNGTVPGPVVRLREGQDAIIRVTNKLHETTSIHWHGILLPPEMDGVPGVSFAGIKPGETFTYRFPVKQYGTYWYHSHSGGQEAEGLYAPLIIDPAKTDPFEYDREYPVLLSDWSFIEPMKLIAKLKKDNAYFNYQRRTVGDFIRDTKQSGLRSTLKDRLDWMRMRMDATDILDITGSTYSYLMNGLTPEANWNVLFRKGEKIRLRFIGGAAMSIFDVRIPGAKMTLVQADGQNVQPVKIEEFRISPGETYDVIVKLNEDRPYAIFAESMDRSGYAMGTLSPTAGARAPVPERRKRPLRTMSDMGMAMGDMKEMSMSGMDMPGMDMSGHGAMKQGKHGGSTGGDPVKHGPDHHGPGNAFVPDESKSRLHEPGTGLENNSRRVLVYTDLKSIHPFPDQRAPAREIELHLTGNMERFMWSIDGKKFSESPQPIVFRSGERLRLTFVNDTMMEHPMHLHGMWMYLENGSGAHLPRKHTVLVKPAERLSVAITADAPVGDWAFHCHMLFHMEMGMFRVVRVTNETPAVKA